MSSNRNRNQSRTRNNRTRDDDAYEDEGESTGNRSRESRIERAVRVGNEQYEEFWKRWQEDDEREMIKNVLDIKTARSAMKVLAEGLAADELTALGISDVDFKVATGARQWIGTDRPRVKNVIDGMMFGSLDMLGLPRIEVPAEYLAAALAMFVHPTNLMIACRWFEGAQPANVLMGGTEIENVSSRTLFALCLAMAESESASYARTRFTKRTQQALNRALGTAPALDEEIRPN